MPNDSHQGLGAPPEGLYLPLSQDDSTIRLLKLPPSTGEEIQVSLCFVSMDQAENMSYTAISYAWGEREDRFPISVNGHLLNVDGILSRLLGSPCLRKISASPYFWVDRICIDQSNTTEHAEQIRRMGMIYSRAAILAILVGLNGTCVDSSRINLPKDPFPGAIHQAVDCHNFPDTCKVPDRAPCLDWQGNITPILETCSESNLAVRNISVHQWAGRGEIGNAMCSVDTGVGCEYTTLQIPAAKTLAQKYRELHDHEMLCAKSSKVDISLTPLHLADSMGNIEVVQLLLLRREDHIGHTQHFNGSKKAFVDSNQWHPFQETRKEPMRYSPFADWLNRNLSAVEETLDYRGRSDADSWIQSTVETQRHQSFDEVAQIARILELVTVDKSPSLKRNLVEGMTPLAAAVMSGSQEVIEMLLRSILEPSTEIPRKVESAPGQVIFGIAAQLLTRWTKCLPAANGAHSGMVFPIHMLEDWEILRRTITLNTSASSSDLPSVERRVADAFGWWQLQVKSALLLNGPEREEYDQAKQLNRSKFTSQWARLYGMIFPSSNLERHFAVRSACCVASSFRPLNSNELFSLATAKILQDDPEWPWRDADQGIDGTGGVRRLMSLCGLFLCTNSEGLVHFKQSEVANLLSRQLVGFVRDAHHFMAFACLKQIEVMGPHLLLEPWEDFQVLQERHQSHNYAVTFWQYHYRIAEKYSQQLLGRLQTLLDQACLAAKQASLYPHLNARARNEVDEFALERTSRAVHMGYEFCRKYNFGKLENIYELMGARARAWDCSLCQNWSNDTGEETPSAEASEVFVYDYEDWQMVEPVDLEGI